VRLLRMGADCHNMNFNMGPTHVTLFFNEAYVVCSSIFTARRHASAVYAVVVCLYVCLSVTSRCSTKMAINVGSRKQRHTTAQGL